MEYFEQIKKKLVKSAIKGQKFEYAMMPQQLNSCDAIIKLSSDGNQIIVTNI